MKKVFEQLEQRITFSTKQINNDELRVYVHYDGDVDYDAIQRADTFADIIRKANAVGFLDLSRLRNKFMLVENVFVHPSFQRYGIGVALYNNALQVAQQYNTKGLASDPEERNLTSDTFWNKYSQGKRSGYDIITSPLPQKIDEAPFPKTFKQFLEYY